MSTSETVSDRESVQGVQAWVAGKLRQVREGWPPHLVLDCSDAETEAYMVLASLPAVAERNGFVYLSLDRLSPGKQPLDQLANRFLALAARDLPAPKPEEKSGSYLRFAAAVSAACLTQVRPILISISDAEAIGQRPDGISILSAVRAALNEAQGSICAIFLLPSLDGLRRFHRNRRSPFYGFGTALSLGAELERDRSRPNQ